MAEAPMVTRRFVYAGKRRSGKSLVPVWLPEGAEPVEANMVAYTKAKGHLIGGIYEILVSENGDTYRPTSVSFVEPGSDHELTLMFEADDRSAGVRHRLSQLERSQDSQIKDLCAPLRELVNKQVGWANRAALMSYIASEITR